jgi:hypothetical protein
MRRPQRRRLLSDPTRSSVGFVRSYKKRPIALAVKESIHRHPAVITPRA